MPAAESLNFLLRAIREKHDAVLSTCRVLLVSFGGESAGERKRDATAAKEATQNLMTLLAASDVPHWLSNLDSGLKNYLTGSWSGSDFLQNFISLKAALESHQWSFDESSESAFDFDAVFEEYKAASKLPELLDDIVRILQSIHGSGAVESNTMLSALSKVIATLKESKTGSSFSLNCAWSFLINFINNYMWGMLSGMPELGTVFAALDKAVTQAGAEIDKVNAEVREELQARIKNEVKGIKSVNAFPGYDRTGRLEACTQTPRLTGISASA